jgi:hypothetical protein
MRSSPHVLRDISALSPHADPGPPGQAGRTSLRPMRSLVAQGEEEADAGDFGRQPESDLPANIPL